MCVSYCIISLYLMLLGGFNRKQPVGPMIPNRFDTLVYHKISQVPVLGHFKQLLSVAFRSRSSNHTGDRFFKIQRYLKPFFMVPWWDEVASCHLATGWICIHLLLLVDSE